MNQETDNVFQQLIKIQQYNTKLTSWDAIKPFSFSSFEIHFLVSEINSIEYSEISSWFRSQIFDSG